MDNTTTTIASQQPTTEEIARFKDRQQKMLRIKRYFPGAKVHPYQMKETKCTALTVVPYRLSLPPNLSHFPATLSVSAQTVGFVRVAHPQSPASEPHHPM